MALRDATMARGRIRRDAIAWLTSESSGGAGLDAAELLSECGIDPAALRAVLRSLAIPARRSDLGPGRARIQPRRVFRSRKKKAPAAFAPPMSR